MNISLNKSKSIGKVLFGLAVSSVFCFHRITPFTKMWWPGLKKQFKKEIREFEKIRIESVRLQNKYDDAKLSKKKSRSRQNLKIS